MAIATKSLAVVWSHCYSSFEDCLDRCPRRCMVPDLPAAPLFASSIPADQPVEGWTLQIGENWHAFIEIILDGARYE